MAKVTLVITDVQDDAGRPGTDVAAFSTDVEDRASIANLVCLYLADQWDAVVAAARGHALQAFAEALKQDDTEAPATNGHSHAI